MDQKHGGCWPACIASLLEREALPLGGGGAWYCTLTVPKGYIALAWFSFPLALELSSG